MSPGVAEGAGGVVVVGAGLGGLRVVEQLRRRDFTGRITLVGDEAREPYDRPPLSKAVLRGEKDETPLRAELGGLDLDLRLATEAVSVDPDHRAVVLADGTTLGYDSLVLAPGARPKLPPGIVPGPGIHVLRTHDDAHRLREALGRVGSVIVIGGGFIGSEVASSARSLGVEVDLVEALAMPLLGALGEAGAREVTALHEANGVRLYTGVGVAAVRRGPDGGVTGVELADGRTIDGTVLVFGLGVTPNVEWLDGSGIELADGIRCDASGRTSRADVYAVGDAAQWHHPLAGGHRRVEHWTTVVEQAAVVAATIVGQQAENAEVPYFWSDLYDVKVQALGFGDPGHEIDVVRPNGRLVLLRHSDGRLQSVVGFSAARAIMPLRASVAAGAEIDEIRARLAPTP